ncbi:methylcytosine dioxygenase TET-like [Uranotaenia lowii]|uniref:methylcytosine dioxygenase TET-like n=1 Tax=Uranotaenia lowii TaxID=190385 RepID=UPI00247B2A1D|nr:methylcytosine dioxygenase TET-like [Uranotaenia lowii]
MTSMMSATTAEETADHSLPSFASFSAELEPSWDYYDRQERSNGSTNGGDVISSQASNSSYTRPWEMDSKDQRAVITNGGGGGGGFEPFPKLPSFQSQFHGYTDTVMAAPEPSLPQVTAVPVPISPNAASPGTGGSLTQLTQLTPTPLTPLQSGLTQIGGSSFHTLSAVNPRPYPIVPAPIQARDIPTINHQYIDERHIQLYQPIYGSQPQTIPTVTVLKNEVVDFDLSSLKNGTLHHANFQNPLLDQNIFSQNGAQIHAPQQHHPHHQPQHHPHHHQQQHHHPQHQTQHHLHQPQHNLVTPSIQEHHITNHSKLSSSTTPGLDSSTPQITRIGDNRKKERRKMRDPSLESSADSEGSAMEIGDSGNPGQVAAISSTANFKSPMHTMSMDTDDSGMPGEKQTKKKRKRCGECVGCSRKDNCGDCAPCRNDKSHQICKTRRCEKLTEKKFPVEKKKKESKKKILYGPDGQLLKPESKRGRGKGKKNKEKDATAATSTSGGATNTDANGQAVTFDANGQPVREGKRGRGRGRAAGRLSRGTAFTFRFRKKKVREPRGGYCQVSTNKRNRHRHSSVAASTGKSSSSNPNAGGALGRRAGNPSKHMIENSWVYFLGPGMRGTSLTSHINDVYERLLSSSSYYRLV